MENTSGLPGRLHIYTQNLNVKNRLFFVRVVVCTGLISGFLCSYYLWINDRFYPLAPVADFIPILYPPLDSLLFIVILVLLTLIIFYPNKFTFFGLFILLLYSVLQDQSRLQPWFFQYNFLLGVIYWFELRPNRERGELAMVICHVILIGIYVWSGLHKLNYSYLYETFEWLLGPALEVFPFLKSLPLSTLAVLSALIETGAGIALAFHSTRKYGVWILISMHIFTLFMVGPAGLAYNSVVWPWNICFILLLIALFLGKDTGDYNHRVLIPQNLYHGVVIIIFLFVPILNFVNLLDHFPSASLYSGKKPYAIIHVSDTVKDKFPARVTPEFNLLNELNIRDWSYAELNVPDYSQIRIYKQIFRKLCSYQHQKYGLVLEMYDTANLLTGKRSKEVYFCHEL